MHNHHGLQGPSANPATATVIACMRLASWKRADTAGLVQYAGLALAPVAVLFMIYALYMYKKRTIQIMQQRKSVRYDDQRGPVLLVVLLVGATLAAMIITAKAAFS